MPKTLENTTRQNSVLSDVSTQFGVDVSEPVFDGLNFDEVESGHVMVIDDEAINIKLVRKVLQEKGFFRFSDVTDPREALAKIRTEAPDIILLDIMMPHISGLELLEAIRASAHLQHVPVLILTASTDRETKLEALELGATDFLMKPVDRAELIPRVRNALKMKACHDHFQNSSNRLAQTVKQRTEEIALSRIEIVNCLARAAEFHDDITGRHTVRVGRYAALIGRELGLPTQQLQLLELAAQLHDVGKIGIPDSILQKEGQLTPEEFNIMKRHCAMGKSVFEGDSGVTGITSGYQAPSESQKYEPKHSPLLQLAARIALTHHERWDGTGYPMGLAGEQIPLEGRITAVADVFDALSCKRSYKDAFPLNHCFELLDEGRASQFDPEVLDAFLKCRDEVLEIQIGLADA